MVRIVTTNEGRHRIVHVQGHLSREDVPVLDDACRRIAGGFQLHLGDLQGIDEAGVSAIRRLTEHGARVVGASPYVSLRLAVEANRQGVRGKRSKRRKSS